MFNLYPPIESSAHGFLKVDQLHNIYWEQSGNPNGVPVLFLHGGPGSGTNPSQRRYFDPKYYRIILFDQRGSGKSQPFAEIKDNTIWHLVDDIEALRKYFGVSKWIVFGGSWGVTLSLTYGIMFPHRCIAFVLRGIFLGRQIELDWFLNGIKNIFPESHKKFVEFLPKEERNNLLSNFHQRLINTDKTIHLPAAYAWNRFEMECSSLIQKVPVNQEIGTIALARIEAHYFLNQMFLKDWPILKHLKPIQNHKTFIIHGRYDIICPTITAVELATRLPNSDLKILPKAGHSAMEQEISSALIEVMDQLRNYECPQI